MKKILFFLVAFLATQITFAQQDAQFSQYLFNQLYFNPATSGIDAKSTQATLIHRSQWFNYQPTFDDGGAPTTQSFTLSMPLTKYNLGWGLMMVNDQTGASSNQQAQLSLAYHIQMKKSTLSFGMRSGIYNAAIDFGLLRPRQDDDPLLKDLISRQMKLSSLTADLAAGIYYNSERIFTGLSVNHLNESSFQYESVTGFNALKRHINFIYGMNFFASNTITLKPSILVKSDLNSLSYEGGFIADFDDKYYIGGSYRDSDAFIMLLGMNALKNKQLRIGYAFDYVYNGKSAKTGTSHEIMLNYRLPAPKFYVPSPIRSPRYRF